MSKTLQGWTCLAAGLVPRLISEPDLSKNFGAGSVQKLWGWKCLKACSVQKFRAGNVSRPVIIRGRDSLGALTYDKAERLNEMVDILAEQMEGMEDTWDDILENVRACSIDIKQDTLFEELSRLVTSTRRIVDMALKWSGKFFVGSPFHKGPSKEETVNVVTNSGRH